MTQTDIESVRAWMRHRPLRGDKTTMLLEHFLVLNFDNHSGQVRTTRQALRDFTGWSPKTLSKALDTLAPMNVWFLEEDDQYLTFTPLVKDAPTSEPHFSTEQAQQLIWSGSSLSGNTLLVALFISRRIDNQGESLVSLRELASSLGMAVNTVRKAIEEMLESGEWERLMDPRATRLRLISSTLLAKADQSRSSQKAKNGSRLPPQQKTVVADPMALPFMLDDWHKMNRSTIRPFRTKRTVKGYAQRLLDCATPEVREQHSRTFNLANLSRLYSTLMPVASIEIVDTLLTYQVVSGNPLDLRFLKPVAIRLERASGEEPQRFNREAASSGAWLTAMAVHRIMASRRMDGTVHANGDEQDSESGEPL